MSFTKRLRYVAPSAVTLAGFTLGLWGISRGVHAGLWMLIASLALDVVDGTLARALCVATKFGARLDYTVDVVLTHVMLFRTLPTVYAVPACAVVIAQQSEANAFEDRVSGRAAVWGLCIAASWFGVLGAAR